MAGRGSDRSGPRGGGMPGSRSGGPGRPGGGPGRGPGKGGRGSGKAGGGSGKEAGESGKARGGAAAPGGGGAGKRGGPGKGGGGARKRPAGRPGVQGGTERTGSADAKASRGKAGSTPPRGGSGADRGAGVESAPARGKGGARGTADGSDRPPTPRNEAAARRERVARAPQVSLARALSKLGRCSRAEARPLIEAGRVSVDGDIVRDPERRVDVRRSRIAVDGSIVRAATQVYLMLHKPRGWVTTTSDEHGRSTVYELLPDDMPRLVAVGRLDLDSDGLLLFTNDTRWADRIADPARHIDKVYHVQAERIPDEEEMEAMLRGVDAGRGEVLRLKSVRRLERRGRWLEVVIDEGRNRQIRRVFEALGIGIERLTRVAIGSVELGDLGPGTWRLLTQAERQALAAAVGD